MATRIDSDGTQSEVLPRGGSEFTLDELYEHVGCQIVEAIGLTDGRTLWLDEEGKFADEVIYNKIATGLLQEAGGIATDYVAGHALVTEAAETG